MAIRRIPTDFRLRRSARRLPTALGFALALAACGDGPAGPGEPEDPVPTPSATLEVVEGNGQQGVVGQILTDPVILRLRDFQGAPLTNVTVTFSAGSGGRAGKREKTTGFDGRVSFRWRLGPAPGGQEAEVASAESSESLELFATAVILPDVDVVTVPGLDPTDRLGAVVDGRTSVGPANDFGYAGTTPLPVGEWQSPSGEAGSSEMMVFLPGRGPVYVAEPGWTDGADEVEVEPPDPIALPVTVWILQGPFDRGRNRLLADLLTTQTIYDGEGMGVLLDPVEFEDATAVEGVEGFLNFECSLRAGMQELVGAKPDRINVYVVESVDGSATRGQACEIGGNFVALGQSAGPTLLSHEIGHNLALVHPDFDLENFDARNVMHSASDVRRFLTEGQVFRAHLNGGSALNELLGVHGDADSRTCFFTTVDPRCPPTHLRLWPDGDFDPFPSAGGDGPATGTGTPGPLTESCGLHLDGAGRPLPGWPPDHADARAFALRSPDPPAALVARAAEAARARVGAVRRHLEELGPEAPSWATLPTPDALDPATAEDRAVRALRRGWRSNVARVLDGNPSPPQS